MPDAYVAPRAYPLTVLHRPDPDAGPCADGEGEPCTGRTVCGEFMGVDELWMPVDRRDGDRVCPACAGPRRGRAGGAAVMPDAPVPPPVKVIWNGHLYESAFSMPGATAADLVEALCGRLQLPAIPVLGLFDDGDIEVDGAAPLPADGREYVLRPRVVH